MWILTRGWLCALAHCILLQTVFASIASDCLEQHNFYRSKHGVPALEYSEELAKNAQRLADIYTTGKVMEEETKGLHDVNFFRGYWRTARTISDALQNWYNGGRAYNYENPKITSSSSSFLEVVWKSHKQVGCGLSITEQDGGISTVVVAMYVPAAYRADVDDYVNNVPPPQKAR